MRWILLLLVTACVAPLAQPPAAPPGNVDFVSPTAPDDLAGPSAPEQTFYERLNLPHAEIGHWPTPVTALPELAEALGVKTLHVKRDDRSAKPYGGGKPRKLELLLGAALAEGKREVVTIGGVGSHHAVATAIYARRLGLKTTLLLLPQWPSEEVKRVLLASHAAGAHMVMAGDYESARRLAESLRAADPDGVAVIPVGGSSALGNVSFVNAAFELKRQIDAGELPEPDEVYIPLGTMGSAVGLAIGFAAADMKTQVVAVRASNRPTSTWTLLARMHQETLQFLRERDPAFPGGPLNEKRLRIETGFLGRGYAQPTPAGTLAIALGAKHGLRLDSTYTAKAFAALLAKAKGNGRHVLFWHTHAETPLSLDESDVDGLPRQLRPYAR